MKDTEGGSPFVTMLSQQQEAIIDYNFYFSTTRVHRDNILSLENVNNQSRGLQVFEVCSLLDYCHYVLPLTVSSLTSEAMSRVSYQITRRYSWVHL